MLVLAGGLLTATLPASTPLLKALPVLVVTRDHTAGRMLGLALVLVGLGVLAASWLRLCQHASVSQVRLATVVWSLPLLVAPPLFSRDGWSYAAQGALAHRDLSPYAYGPAYLIGPTNDGVDPMWWFTPAPYGPLPLAFGDLASGLTDSPWLLVVAHRGLALVGLALLAWAVPRLAGWTGAYPALASALVLASPLMLANGVAGLHNDLLMVGLMAAALVVAVEHGWVWGAALAGAAAAVKAPGGLVCLAIVLASLPAGAILVERLRRTAAVGAVAVGVLVGLGLVTGLGSGWVAGLAVPGSIDTPLSVTSVVGNALGLHDAIRTLGSLAALGVGAWVLLTRPTGRPRLALHGLAVTMLAVVVLSPVVHLWYFLWAVPFLATLRLSRPQMTGLVAISVVLGLVAPLDSSLHGAYVAIVAGSMLAAVLATVLLLTRRARERVDRIATVR